MFELAHFCLQELQNLFPLLQIGLVWHASLVNRNVETNSTKLRWEEWTLDTSIVIVTLGDISLFTLIFLEATVLTECIQHAHRKSMRFTQ
jgi:hypothetical protein